MKNKAIIIITLLFCTNFIIAQTSVQKTISNAARKTIVMDFDRSDVKIIAWDKSEVEIKGAVSINNGDNDENYTIDVNEKGDAIEITTFIKDLKKLPKMTVIRKGEEKHFFKNTPEGKKALKAFKASHGGSYDSWSNSVYSEISLEIHVPRNSNLSIESLYGDVELENVSSKLDIKNTYGHVNVVLGNEPVSKPMRLCSTYAFVDVSLPASAKLDLNLKAGYGEIFTDLNIQQDSPSKSRKNFGSKVNGSINGGGVLLAVEAGYNNIYLRKM